MFLVKLVFLGILGKLVFFECCVCSQTNVFAKHMFSADELNTWLLGGAGPQPTAVFDYGDGAAGIGGGGSGGNGGGGVGVDSESGDGRQQHLLAVFDRHTMRRVLRRRRHGDDDTATSSSSAAPPQTMSTKQAAAAFVQDFETDSDSATQVPTYICIKYYMYIHMSNFFLFIC